MDLSEKTTRIGEPGAPPPGNPYLSAVSGRHAGRLYAIEANSTRLLGRTAVCDPRFPDDLRISRLHAEVSAHDDGTAHFRDVSRNGTSVGGRLVHNSSVQLRHGDWIILGSEAEQFRAEWLSDDEVKSRLLLFQDELTGIWRKRHLEARLRDVLDDSEDMREPLSVVMWDVDHFGNFNREHGQTCGDMVLRAVARGVSSTVRELHPAGDTARIGGEEFLILMPQCPGGRAQEIAEACRGHLEALRLSHGGKSLNVTASFGVATCQPSETLRLDDLVVMANEQEIRAKRAGRNRVCWDGDGASPVQ